MGVRHYIAHISVQRDRNQYCLFCQYWANAHICCNQLGDPCLLSMPSPVGIAHPPHWWDTGNTNRYLPCSDWSLSIENSLNKKSLFCQRSHLLQPMAETWVTPSFSPTISFSFQGFCFIRVRSPWFLHDFQIPSKEKTALNITKLMHWG